MLRSRLPSVVARRSARLASSSSTTEAVKAKASELTDKAKSAVDAITPNAAAHGGDSHGSHKKSSDVPWMVGSALVFVPLTSCVSLSFCLDFASPRLADVYCDAIQST